MLNGKKALIVSQGPRNEVLAKIWVLLHFFSEKGDVEKDASDANAKLLQ